MSTADTDQADRVNARKHLYDAFVDDYAQKAAINRATYAAGYGIDPGPYSRPFPGTSPQIHVTESQRSVGSQWTAAILAGLASLSTLGAAGAGYLLSRPAVPPAVPAIVQPAQEPTLEPVRGRIRFWTDDGTQIQPAQD